MTAKRPKVERVSADAETFRKCLKLMSWSQQDAAEALGIHSRQRVSEFCRGVRPVPPYITKHLALIVDMSLKKRGI